MKRWERNPTATVIRKVDASQFNESGLYLSPVDWTEPNAGIRNSPTFESKLFIWLVRLHHCETLVEAQWASFAEVMPDREYLALISFLPRKTFWQIFGFFRQTSAIQNQLRVSKGLVGYSLRTEILGKKAWTLSVWEDENALAEFVNAVPHSETMKRLGPKLSETKFVTWKIASADIPPKWEDALKRL